MSAYPESADIPDPLQFIDNLAPMRESLLGMVAAFVADGFTDEQSREIAVASLIRAMRGIPS